MTTTRAVRAALAATCLALAVVPLHAKTLRFSSQGDITTIDPLGNNEGFTNAYLENIYETLLTRDAGGELEPLLATGYTQVDDTTWEFTLREGVSFHNGAPFNAEAAAFSINRIIDPATASDQVSNFATIVSAEAASEYVVRIITNGPDPILPARMNMLMIIEPGHV